MTREKIVDEVFRRHKIDLKNPKFDVAIVIEMIHDALASYNKEPGKGDCPLCNGTGKRLSDIDVSKYYDDDEASPSALPENKDMKTVKVSVSQWKGMRHDMDMAMRREIFLLDKIKSVISEEGWNRFLDENNFTEVPELIRLKYPAALAASALPNKEDRCKNGEHRPIEVVGFGENKYWFGCKDCGMFLGTIDKTLSANPLPNQEEGGITKK